MRNYNFDWIRVMAMIGVSADHYIGFVGCNWLNNCGLQLGGMCVTIFFIISALLFGNKWIKDGHKSFKTLPFLKKRVLRIYIPMWILILAVVPLEWWLVGRFEIQTIVANAIGAGWVRPFGISGHLWYITMMMVLYVGFIAFSHFRLDKIHWYWWGGMFGVLVVIYFGFQEKITTYSKAGPPLFTFFSLLFFCKGKEVLKVAKEHRLIILVATITMVVLSQYVYQLGWHDSHKALAIGSFICAGFLLFLSLYSYLSISKENKIISWVSGISYEIYLVHIPVRPLAGLVVDNLFLRVLLCLILTIIFSMGFNKLSNKFVSVIR